MLLLHRNNLETLKGCDRFFPNGLTTLTLNGNDLTDLTEVSFLSGLTMLEQLTLADNPCILQPEDESKQFDYRPYVINWCLGLRVLDGVHVGAKERYVDTKVPVFFLFNEKSVSVKFSGVNISHENQNYSEADLENFKTFPNLKKNPKGKL